MEKEAFEKYLQERYYDQMNYYDKKSGFNQTRYKKFQWVLIVLSALTPVLAALDGKWMNLQMAVVITSAIVAILTTGLKTFQYQELWVTYRATQEQLKPEIYYYRFNIGPYAEASIDKESLFVTRVESILDKEHAGWPPAKKGNDNQGNGGNENMETPPANSTGNNPPA
ncbi:MAG: DUF4231 domain-containing protein [Bacteroidia bacterium]